MLDQRPMGVLHIRMAAILKMTATVGQICDGPIAKNLSKAQFLHTSAGLMYLYEYFYSKFHTCIRRARKLHLHLYAE